MIAVFEPSGGCFHDFRYERGGVFPVSNEQARALAQWHTVKLFKSGRRIALVLRYARDRPELLEIAACSLLPYSAEDAPEVPDGAPPGSELCGSITVLPPPPTFEPFVYRISRADDTPATEHREPDGEDAHAPAAPAPSPAEVFAALGYACDLCDDAFPSDARRSRHVEMNHPEVFFASAEEQQAIAAAARARREVEERLRRAADPPPPPVWDRELAAIPDDDERPAGSGPST